MPRQSERGAVTEFSLLDAGNDDRGTARPGEGDSAVDSPAPGVSALPDQPDASIAFGLAVLEAEVMPSRWKGAIDEPGAE